MNERLRKTFDALLEEVLAELPGRLQRLLQEVPLIVDDRPDPGTLERTGLRHPRDLCGLYTGIPLTGRSVQHSGTLPDKLCLFREGIAAAARGSAGRQAELKRQIRITVLHEMGHHFGLDEDDLRELGYQ